MTPHDMKLAALKNGLVAALTLAIAGGVYAQGGPMQGPGGFGGFGGARGGLPPGVLAGTVQSVNPEAHTITLTTRSGETCTMYVPSTASVIGQKTISASDLNVGDKIQIRGHASSITADSIVAAGPGANLPPMGPPERGQGPGGFGPPQGGGQDSFGPPQGGEQGGFGPPPGQGAAFGPGPNGRTRSSDGTITEDGTITSLHPLTISFGGGRTLTVQFTSSTKVHTIGSMKLAEIKKGDHIFANGTPASDGDLNAVRVAINMPPPPGRFGMAGRGTGMRGGMGGPGMAMGMGPGMGQGGPGMGMGPGDPDGGFDPQGPPPPDPGDANGAGPGGPGPDGGMPDAPPPPDPSDGPPAE